MSQLCTFAGVRIALPNGWVDTSDDMPKGIPPTLAKPEGVGALQFSVGRYLSGADPQVSLDDLDAISRSSPTHVRLAWLRTLNEASPQATMSAGASCMQAM